MEMQRLTGGNLRAAGYDIRARKLVIELTSGTYEYQGVPSEVWRRFSDASSPWSYYRDNIEEEYTAKRVASNASGTPSGKNPLDDLFG